MSDARSSLAGVDEDQIASLRQLAGRNPDLLRRLVDSFLESVPEQLERISQASRAGDSRALEENAHKLKGASLSLGLKAIGEVCERLETIGFQGQAENLDSVLAELARQLDRAEFLLQSELLR